MGFWDHLDELRGKLVLCLWIFFIGFIGLYFVSDHILDFLRRPLFMALPPEKQHLYYTGLFENFLVHLKVAAAASLALFSPIYFLILWSFVAPGLKPHEKKTIRPFIAAGAVFFLVGSGFAYFVLFPVGVKFFLTYGTAAEVPLLTLESYVSLVLKILIGFGLCFELPVVIVLLGKFGLLTAEQLAAQRRTAIIVITALSAFVAPPDAISMLMLMAPLYLLYETAIVVVRKVMPNTANQVPAGETANPKSS